MIAINYRDPRPIYEQIQAELRRLMLTGALPPGSRLPSVRELAGQLAINPNTIQRAYRELESEGYILSVAGKGSFVAQVDRLAEQQKKEALNAFRAAAQRLRALGLSAEALASLLIENIVGVKEASGNISQIAKIAELCGESFDIYSGNDDQIVPLLSLGGKGVISVLSNIAPRETHDIVAKFMDGDVKGSRELQLRALPLIEKLFCEVNPIPVKAAMNMLGWEVGPLRMPLSEMEEEHQKELKAAMDAFGVKAKGEN